MFDSLIYRSVLRKNMFTNLRTSLNKSGPVCCKHTSIRTKPYNNFQGSGLAHMYMCAAIVVISISNYFAGNRTVRRQTIQLKTRMFLTVTGLSQRTKTFWGLQRSEVRLEPCERVKMKVIVRTLYLRGENQMLMTGPPICKIHTDGNFHTKTLNYHSSKQDGVDSC